MAADIETIRSPFTSSTHTFYTAAALQEQSCFSSDDFLSVMQNLILNPNILSSHLFRADILWDSDKDTTFEPHAVRSDDTDLSSFVKHMKREYRPWKINIRGLELRRTVVRQLIPRNAHLDRPLIQTCHTFTSQGNRRLQELVGNLELIDDEDENATLVIYLPHADSEDDVPWYHPPLRGLGFLYRPNFQDLDAGDIQGTDATLSIHYCAFGDEDMTPSISPRTTRSLANLLRTIHKHSKQQKTYEKRVHHDRIIPQKRFQDTYARLKQKYAKQLIDNWREQTNVGKGVFEDLGIAAFLIELWRDMYGDGIKTHTDDNDRASFPGFVDLACGNGCLVHILCSEGYSGWGFDARSRKTWDAFPSEVHNNLNEMLLVPYIISDDTPPLPNSEQRLSDLTLQEVTPTRIPVIHDGIFPPRTFLISNHADELTPWTPLLAYLNRSPFIAIPCCSHALDGSKYRYPGRYAGGDEDGKQEPNSEDHTKEEEEKHADIDSGADALEAASSSSSISTDVPDTSKEAVDAFSVSKLGKPTSNKSNANKSTSAYSTLCGYISQLTKELGYDAEKEVLRIPSTRNVCLVGRPLSIEEDDDSTLTTEGANEKFRVREEVVKAIIERDAQQPLSAVAAKFKERAMGVYESKGRNH